MDDQAAHIGYQIAERERDIYIFIDSLSNEIENWFVAGKKSYIT